MNFPEKSQKSIHLKWKYLKTIESLNTTCNSKSIIEIQPLARISVLKVRAKTKRMRPNRKYAQKHIIQSAVVQQINDATIVLRHFIELSAKLLPLLNDLSKKKNLSIQEHENKLKIMDVFRNYRFDTDTSLILMKSSILDTIQQAFSEIEKRENKQTSNSDKLINLFNVEHQKLVTEWIKTDCN